VALPEDEQDAIASQILASLADEDDWKKRFAEKRDVIRRMAGEALEEEERGETMPLDELLRCGPGPPGGSGVLFRICPPTHNGRMNRSAALTSDRLSHRTKGHSTCTDG